MNERLRISACMMVRNEEKNLERCLKSIKDFVDEIVLVDTGSTDRTMEIARLYGARIYEHPWENDFSVHRNQSIGYARSPWVLIIDADEELVREASISKIRESIRALEDKTDCMIVDVRDMQQGKVAMEFQSARLFRRDRVHYRDAVHNRPIIPSNRGIHTPQFWLKHYGYDLTPEEKARKFERTSTLLLKRLADNPEDHQCYFYLCQLYADAEEKERALEYGKTYCKYEDKSDFNEAIFYTMFCLTLRLKQDQEAGGWLKRGLARIPDDLDLNHGLIELGLQTKQTEFIYRGAKNFAKIYEGYRKDPSLKGKRFIYTLKTEALGFIRGALIVAHFEDGVKYLRDLEKMELPPEYKRKIFGILQEAMGSMDIPISMDLILKPAEAEKSKLAIAH